MANNIRVKNLITVKEAAALLSVTPLTLRNWDKAGKLKALRHPLNNYRVYKTLEIEKLLLSMAEGAKPLYIPHKKKTRKLDVVHE